MKLPASYEYNLDVTRRVVEMAPACDVSVVEDELGCPGSLETRSAAKEDCSGAKGRLDRSQLLPDPDQAADFVKRTKVDALAIGIGTWHEAYKVPRPLSGDISRERSQPDALAGVNIDQTPTVRLRLGDRRRLRLAANSLPCQR
jgi:fructose/tagatose bisphosphate aldolase